MQSLFAFLGVTYGMELRNSEKRICNFCDTDFVGINGENGGEYKLDDL